MTHETPVDCILIPIYGRGGVVAHAKVSPEDAGLAAFRWYLVSRGYAGRRVGKRTVYMHREVLGLDAGSPLYSDHLNHCLLDNRRSNLRATTPLGNMQNRRPNRNPGRSGVRSVIVTQSGRFKVRVPHKYGYKSGGTFDTLEVSAERAAELRAQLGYIDHLAA